MNSKHASNDDLISAAPQKLALFDSSHGQPNWAQTGFTSREMHTNYAGVMELLCRLGCTCAQTGRKPSAAQLSDARLLVIPPPTGCYNAAKERWMPNPESLFTGESVRDILRFMQDGGRLLAFAYRFGDWFTQSNLRELLSPLGCLLNDDAVVDLQVLRNTNPLQGFFDTQRSLLPLAWSADGVSTVRWRTMATFTILPGAQARPLALSAGGSCISFNRTFKKISFASLPIAVAGVWGCGRFALFGGPHAFETGRFGLLTSQDNARFLKNVLRWLLDDSPACLNPEPTAHHSDGTFFFNNGLDVIRSGDTNGSQQTIAYVERMMRRTGMLKALGRANWMS
jgi:hypothetical protein